MADSKKCMRCKTIKLLSQFGRSKTLKGGGNRICRPCSVTLYGADRIIDINTDVNKLPHLRVRKRQYAPQKARDAYLLKSSRLKPKGLDAYALKNPGVIFKREAAKFRPDQFVEAIEFVEANPGSTLPIILQEAGLSPYFWKKIEHLFDRTVTPRARRWGSDTYSRNSTPYVPPI